MRREATHFAVAATSQHDALSCLNGRSHGELGDFTAYSLPLSSDRNEVGRDSQMR